MSNICQKVKSYEEQYWELVDALCPKSWLPRNNHESVLKLARRLRDNQLRIRPLAISERTLAEESAQWCTRGENHEGPCNGFPREICKVAL